MSDWQPIETAPKDGTACLIWSPDATGHGISLAVFLEFEGDPDGGTWYDEWRDSGYGIDAEPSYWMPLPNPPSSVSATPTEGGE